MSMCQCVNVLMWEYGKGDKTYLGDSRLDYSLETPSFLSFYAVVLLDHEEGIAGDLRWNETTTVQDVQFCSVLQTFSAKGPCSKLCEFVEELFPSHEPSDKL